MFGRCPGFWGSEVGITAVLLKNANVISMKKEGLVESRDVLIDDSAIAQVADGIERSDAQSIDCTGKYLIPGLADMHAHFISSDMFNLFLANGVTTVRNMWGTPKILEWRDDIAAGRRVGPAIFSTSPLMDGIELWEGSEIVKTTEDAERAVLKAKTDGYTMIKTYPSIPREAFVRLMELARQYGMKVVGHGNASVTTDELIELGYHSIEHASLLPKDEDEVLRMAEAGMWFSPTIGIVRKLHETVEENLDLTEIPNYEYVNERERRDWAGIVEMISKSHKMKGYDVDQILELARVFAANSENVLLGTDNTNPGIVTGFSLHDELELEVRDLGLTPFQALATGTVRAVRHLGIWDRAGTIEEGKDADLVLLDANPLEDISHTKKISAVVKSGVYYDRGVLDDMLQSVLHMPDHEVEFAAENVINAPEDRE
jgi:imidazolonepropionase-like amidohydrolase